MRRRRLKLLLFGAVALVVLFGFGRSAGAQVGDPSEPDGTTPAVPVESAVPNEATEAVSSGNTAEPAAETAPVEPAAETAPVEPVAVEAPVGPAGVTQEEPAEEHAPVEDVVHEAEENGATHADAECIETLAEGGTIEDCQAAPNPLLPEINEIIWGVVGFTVVFFFLSKFGLPAIKQTMNDRTERIRSDLQAAEDQRSEAETVLAEYRAQLNDARSEAGRIIEESRQAADAIKHDQEARLQSELAELRERAVADIEIAKAQAMADLRGEVAQLAIGAAELVVQRNLDPATQTQLVEEYINQVAAGS